MFPILTPVDATCSSMLLDGATISEPDTTALPFTSSLADGVDVLMPMSPAEVITTF